MKKSCGAWLLAYVLIAAGIGAVVHRRLPVSQVGIWAGVIAGFFAWLGVAYLFGIPAKLREVAMRKRARDGEPPRDGERVVVLGRINPVGPALTAPLSGAQCVVYDYDIKSMYGKEGVSYYSGFALTPSAIQTTSGSVRLFAWPNLKVPQEVLGGDDVLARANEYVSKTTFIEGGLGKFREGIAQVMEVFKDDDGSVRTDRKFPGAPDEIIRARFREKCIPAGAAVCLIGHYSAQRGGIIPTDEPLMNQPAIELGDAESVIASAQRGVIGYFVGGIFFVAAILAALIGLYAVVPLEASEAMDPAMRFSWREVQLEWLLDARVRPRLGQYGDASVPVNIPSGTAVGRVKNGTTEREVSRATATKNGDVATIDIDGGVISFDVRGHELQRLEIRGRKIDPRTASIRMSDDAGRLTYWSEDVACRVTFRVATK